MKQFPVIFSVIALLVLLLATPQISEGQRGGLFGRGPRTSDIPPVVREGQEEKIYNVLKDIASSQRGMLNVPMDDGRLLRLLTETMGAKNVVEIGTSNGYSGLWLLMALNRTGGKLTTFEIDPQRVKFAAENFKKAGVDHLVTIVEGDAHKEIRKLKEPIDLLFIDADKDGYLHYLNTLLPLVKPGGLIVSHNMNSLNQDYIDALTTNPDLETIIQNQSLGGVGVTLKKR